MSDERVPARIRRLINVESGLNDGIATPFVNLFLAGALTTEAVLHAQSVSSAVVDLVGGAGIGAGVGIVGGALLALSRRHGWGSPEFRPLAILALALCAYSCAVVAGTNGFIAAFIGGMAFGTIAHRNDEEGLRLVEEGGTLLSLVVWFAFGAVMLVPGMEGRQLARRRLCLCLALTVLRMIPVGLALAGSGLDRATVAFVGWFGPRGLASVVFGLIAVDALAPQQSKVVLAVVTVTVASSVLLHGVTASPLAARYGAAATRSSPAEWRGKFRGGADRHPHAATLASALDSPRTK
jgi:NhaP-type Na+/H+ or K+/H+ antiporter